MYLQFCKCLVVSCFSVLGALGVGWTVFSVLGALGVGWTVFSVLGALGVGWAVGPHLLSQPVLGYF